MYCFAKKKKIYMYFENGWILNINFIKLIITGEKNSKSVGNIKLFYLIS